MRYIDLVTWVGVPLDWHPISLKKYVLMNLCCDTIIARHVTTTRVDQVCFKPRVILLIRTILASPIAVVRADRHVPLLVENIVLGYGYIREPEDEGTHLFSKERPVLTCNSVVHHICYCPCRIFLSSPQCPCMQKARCLFQGL